jgi:uncharacterized membrane protein YeaQ/YmgE (transglycosylase-associated protein family)
MNQSTSINNKRRNQMNIKNIFITGLIGAVITLALTNIPFVSLINCLLCAGFWVGPLFAVWLYKRMSGAISTKEGIWIGVTAGAIAGVAGLLLSFVDAAGVSGVINQFNLLLPSEDQIDIGELGGEVIGTLFTLLGVIFDIIVGAIAGFVGAAIFKNKPNNATNPKV